MADNIVSDLRIILEKELFPFVEKPVRYIGNELNCIRKDLKTISLHGVLCFPEVYDIGMSHYGSQILYHIVNKCEQWALSRCYHPWLDAEKIMRKKQIPLYSLEYFTSISVADWLGFSIQYELQYTNFINMLDLAGIPKFSSARRENDPIIIAGGPCMGNIEPIADFLDICVIGDGEIAIVALCKALDRLKQENASRQKKMQALSEIDGVYVPAFYSMLKKGLFVVPELARGKSQVKATKVSQLSEECYPTRPLVPLMEVVHYRLAIEVMRGCTRGCRFCSAGSYYRPIRERNVSSITNQIKEGLESTGWEDVGLLSLSTADYSCFDKLIYEIRKLQKEFHVRVSLPSTRIDALTDEQLQTLNKVSRSTSFTIAPEAGSMRMRNVINKDFVEEKIINTVHTLLENNIQTLKLYFMIGLPTETEEDIKAIIHLVSKISDIVWAKSKRRRVNVSVSPFSPKAHTPFQWEAMDSIQTLLEKGRAIKFGLKSKRNVKVSYREPAMVFLETVLARGDRSLSAVILKAWEKGSRFDGWSDQFSLARWEEAAADIKVSFDPFVQEIPEEQELPWSAVFTGISREFLLNERKKSLKGAITEDCRSNSCIQCGACSICSRHVIKKFELPVSETIVDNSTKKSKKAETIERFVYRVEYSKGRAVRFVSHKSIVNIFHRAFKAAKIPIAYSQGFHPHPRIAFGPPLAVGVMGTTELFDMITTEQVSFDNNTVKAWLPEGLRINKSIMMKDRPMSLNASIVAARYLFEPIIPMSYSQLSDIVNKIRGQKNLCITIEKKGKHIEKDFKPLIYDLTVKENHATAYIEAILSMLPAKTCRPVDLVQCLFPGKGLADFLITRIVCLRGEKSQLNSIC